MKKKRKNEKSGPTDKIAVFQFAPQEFQTLLSKYAEVLESKIEAIALQREDLLLDGSTPEKISSCFLQSCEDIGIEKFASIASTLEQISKLHEILFKEIIHSQVRLRKPNSEELSLFMNAENVPLFLQKAIVDPPTLIKPDKSKE